MCSLKSQPGKTADGSPHSQNTFVVLAEISYYFNQAEE